MFPNQVHHDQFVQHAHIQVDDMQHRLFYVSRKLMKLERAEVEKREVGKFEMKLGSSWRNWKVKLQLESTFKLESLTLSWKSQVPSNSSTLLRTF